MSYTYKYTYLALFIGCTKIFWAKFLFCKIKLRLMRAIVIETISVTKFIIQAFQFDLKGHFKVEKI